MPTLGALRYRLELDGAEVQWELIEAVLEEAIHELPMSSFDVLTEGAFPKNLVGKEVRFEFSRFDVPGDEPLVRVGLIVRVESMHRADATRVRARIHVSNRGFVMGVGRKTRIFHQMTASDIIKHILQENGLPATEIRAAPHVREFTTQYFESDLDFIRRLCEDYGLVMRWAPDKRAELYVGAARGKELDLVGNIAFVPVDDLSNYTAESIHHFVQDTRLTATSVRVAGWDPKRKAPVVGTASVPGATPSFGAEIEDHSPAGVRGTPWGLVPGDTAAKAVITTDDAATAFFRGDGGARTLTAGRAFELDDQADSGLAGKYCVTRVRHHITLTDVSSEMGERALVYENEFECVEASFPCRPPRSAPRPVALAPVIAVVTAIPHQRASKLGSLEVEVKFPNFTGSHVVWLRVAQPFAGANHGIQFLPHINDEVVVQFIDGDPDRPMIIGSLYNGLDKPPAEIPAHHTRNVIRAIPYHPGEKFTGPDEIYFEEDAYHRIVGINAAEDHVIEVGNDTTLHTVRDRVTNVDRDDKQTVKGAMTLDVTKDRTSTVKGNDKTTVEKNHEQVVKQGSKVTVYKKLVVSADEGIELQCGDNSIVISPGGITLSIASGPKVELKGTAITLDNGSGAKVELKPVTITVDNGSGAKVELVGPLVNLN